MAKPLNLTFLSQSKIPQEGTLAPETTKSVGKRKIDFFIPEIQLPANVDEVLHPNPPTQKLVDKINQYIENISDDYFLLGLHLIALHKLLKQSNLDTDQVRSWYAENINMPYSSAMQCKRVAEVYGDNPDLINRYSASGAYLLSSCASHEERDVVWNTARGEKSAPSIRELRETLKRIKDEKAAQQLTLEVPPEAPPVRMSEKEIYLSFLDLSKQARRLVDENDPAEKKQLRLYLLKQAKELIRELNQSE